MDTLFRLELVTLNEIHFYSYHLQLGGFYPHVWQFTTWLVISIQSRSRIVGFYSSLELRQSLIDTHRRNAPHNGGRVTGIVEADAIDEIS